jgi:competence protein ComFC
MMIKAIIDILFPKYCLFCGKPGYLICDYCKKKLIPSLPECYKCRRISQFYKTHDKCADQYSLSSLFWAWQYNSLSSQIIKTLKYKGSFDISEEITNLLLSRLLKTNFLEQFKSPLLIPIPLHKRKERRRGFNQSELIGRSLSENLNLPFSTDLLVRSIYNKPQAEKNKLQRTEISSKTFVFDLGKYEREYNGKEIILVDDVITTGSTLDAASISIKTKSRKILTSGICLFRGKPPYSSDSSAS